MPVRSLKFSYDCMDAFIESYLANRKFAELAIKEL
jgi:hypothetical protein